MYDLSKGVPEKHPAIVWGTNPLFADFVNNTYSMSYVNKNILILDEERQFVLCKFFDNVTDETAQCEILLKEQNIYYFHNWFSFENEFFLYGSAKSYSSALSFTLLNFYDV